jgi:beta-lactamase regulating signal transducer with metallopeptidase domain
MSQWFDWINTASIGWANRFWMATWQAAIVIAIAWLLTTFLRRLSPRVRSWIWRLAYVKILLSLFWTTPIELALLPPVATTQDEPASRERQRPVEPNIDQHASAIGDRESEAEKSQYEKSAPPQTKHLATSNTATAVAETQSLPPSEVSEGTPSVAPSQSNSAAQASLPAASFGWQFYVAIVWLIGLALVIAWLAVDALRAWKLLHHSKSLTDDRWQSLSENVCRQLGLRRAIRLRSSPTVRSPVLIRFLRPAIILPQAMLNLPLPAGEGRGEGATETAERLARKQVEGGSHQQSDIPALPLPSALAQNDLALAIAHEAAHLRRHDLAWNALAAIVHVALYFHPFVWLAHRQIRLEQEMACDEIVLQKLSAAPHEYGRMLVNVVRNIAPGVLVAMK